LFSILFIVFSDVLSSVSLISSTALFIVLYICYAVLLGCQ
jgi:hypothetical protein